MKKSSVILPIITLSLINFASAYYGSYSSFSLSNLLDSIDSSTMILGAVFIISFAFVNFALLRVFRDSKATAGIAAFIVSLLITYEINKRGFDIEELFYNFGYSIGFSSDVLSTIIPLLLIAGIIYLFVKLKTNALFIVGGLLIAVSFTSLIYTKGTTLAIGIALILIGLWLSKKLKYPKLNKYFPNYQQPEENYTKKSRELAAKQRYRYYKELEEEQRRQGKKQRRSGERALRRQKAQEEKVKKRYIRRFGKRAWKKRQEY